jgi:hypothetical protein
VTTTAAEELEWQEGGGVGPHPNRLLPPEERIKRGRMSRWKKAPDGSDIMPTLQRKFLEEHLLLGKLNGESQASWCRENGTSERTACGWKKDRKFINEWNVQLERKRLSPEWNEDIIEALRKTAMDGNHPQHVSAAKELLRLLQLIQPPKVQIEITVPSLNGVSDSDLLELAEIATPEIVVAAREVGVDDDIDGEDDE